MDYIFEIDDKGGRKIHLSKERWSYITTNHSDISNRLEDIKKALIKPDLIVPHKYDDEMRNYYLYYKIDKEYLLVSVKYLNGEGFIATAFMTQKIVKR